MVGVPEQRWQVSSHVSVSWENGRMVLFSPVTGTGLAFDDVDVLRVVHLFSRPCSRREAIAIAGLDAEEVAACIDALIAGGILRDPALAGPESRWDAKSLAFHWVSHQGGFRRASRSTGPTLKKVSPTVDVPLVAGAASSGRDLATLLDARCSRREWPAVPVPFASFSRLLWTSARNRSASGLAGAGADGPVSRPYPSGGAAHSLELYAAIAHGAVDALAAGLYHYRPDIHGLDLICSEVHAYTPFLDAAGQSAGSKPPPIVFAITSRFARQSDVYGHLAYSLVLKEVGCLMQTVYLVAEDLGLAACALGGGLPGELLAELSHTDPLEEPLVGEIMVGPR
jgi:SagB-type dehydrogenase family enzyme